MAPPSYSDLGKSARDLFSKGFNHGFIKLDTTSRTSPDMEFRTGASQNIATGKLFGTVELKYKMPDYGVTLTERWNTDNTLGSEITVEDKLTKGLKLTFDSSFAPQIGKRTGKIKGEFSAQNLKVNGDVSLDFGGPLVNLSAVGSYEGFLIGYQMGYDTQKNKMTHSNIAGGRKMGSYAIHTFVNDSTEFGGNVWHSVSDKLELGANLGWTTGEQTNRFGLAAKYQLDPETIVRAKINNNSQLGVALTHTLNSDLKLSLSTLVNMQGFSEGGHKFGIGLEFDKK